MALPAGFDPEEERMERLLGGLLRAGVVASAVVVLAGGILFLAAYGGSVPRYGNFHGEPADLSTVSGIIGSALDLRGRGLIQLGLLLLIATPILRVIFSLIEFLRQRDRTYVALTSIVLILLLAGLAGSVK